MKSWIEISAAALASNVAAIQAASGAADVVAVIKADGYGHGAVEVAPILADAGVRWFGVTDAAEGAAVRFALAGRRGIRILTMVGLEPAEVPAVERHGLTPIVWTAEHLQALPPSTAIHIEMDTGMARQGTRPGPELERLLNALAARRDLVLEGVMTHFAESETAGSALTALQLQRFSEALAQISGAGFHARWVHAANTSAVDEASSGPRMDELARQHSASILVRTGYAIYGHALPLAPGLAHLAPRLTPALAWKTRIVHVCDLEPGDTVGYGATFTARQPTRLATLPVGYADGFRRAASSGMGNGWVMIHGRRAPVIGRVSMNLATVDVTGIPEVAPGEEVTLLGEGVTAEDHAAWSNTIGYDILCGIRARRVATA